jgi:alanine dehydrogenase
VDSSRPPPPMRYFDAATIRELLPWPQMEAALEAFLREDVAAPLRTRHAIDVPGEPQALLLLMPAWRTGRRIGVKLVTVFPGNRSRGERAVNAVCVLFDARSGLPVAMLDGEELTARRTAGASALAARHLARRDARHLVMVGAGRVAHALVEAYCALRGISRVSLWSRTPEHATAAAAAMAREGLPVAAVRDLETAVRDADVVCCATLATEPLVRGEWLHAGVHLDLVGAYAKSMRETDATAMARANLIVVDAREGALAEGGDIVQAIAEGAIGMDGIAATLADLVCGRHPGRTHAGEITVFKSVGFALEDLAAAEAVLDAPGPHASSR